ncbi:MAG: aldo/keto reductase [Candidatus Aminicenantes bacterium]|nr:MAG: aldo/keto reductase [Candidatus Aminicenantes bacterium]
MSKKEKSKESNREGLSRRRFLGGALASLAGAGLYGQDKVFGTASSLGSNGPSNDGELKIKEFRTLGRTGFKVSDIGLGSGETTDPALLEAVLDAGINYIDTAENYVRGQVESTIGSVLKKRNRKSIFISTKLGLGRKVTKESIIKRANKCLERLQTDYIDCLMIHMPSTVEALKTEEFHSAVAELKTEGKVRFCGLSNHGSQWQEVPETMEKVCLAAAEDGRFDVALFVYNFMQRDMGEKILKAYKEKNIGTTLMKTNPAATYNRMKAGIDKMKEEGKKIPDFYNKLMDRLKARVDQAEAFKKEQGLTSFDQLRDAAIKFVLSHPGVHSACPTIGNYSQLEAYVALSGKKLEPKEAKMLSAYKSTYGQFYCRHACGECESRCPRGVPVNTIMRYNHYFEAQGREKTAMVKYAALQANKADNCLNCSGNCERACPYGVPIQGLLALAHQTLSLA